MNRIGPVAPPAGRSALAPLFVGLPDDHCQCTHMGYVLKGRLKFAFADGTEEIYEGGNAYYVPPGHVPTLYAGTELVEFSSTTELQQTLELVSRKHGGRHRIRATEVSVWGRTAAEVGYEIADSPAATA